MALAAEANVIYAAKGKKVTKIDMRKDPPDEATLAKLIVGPTGNLRAPTLRVGKTMIVGFDEETYRKVLG